MTARPREPASPRDTASPGDTASPALGWVGVAVVTLAAMLSGLLECLLVPLYAGSTPLPVSVLLALISNALLPRLGRACVPTTPAAAVPLFGWLAVVIGFGVVVRPEGDVILPGGPLQWVTYATVLGGALVGTVSVATSAPVRTAPQRPVERTDRPSR